ncbi:MAG: hypothetical protein RLZZ189_2064 [Pseudomonadota bacterium]|jgi:hypothetical protein
MNTIDHIRELSAKLPEDKDLQVVVDLLKALEQNRSFEISQLTELSFEHFNLSMDLIREWRLIGRNYKKI